MTKTPLATHKSDYAHTLIEAINRNLPAGTRSGKLLRLEKIEAAVKAMGDEIEIIVTTKKTNPLQGLPAMPKDEIAKNLREDELDMHGEEDPNDDHDCAGVLCEPSNHTKEE